ncbi:MAG: hypothetical protein EBZ49_14420 [Proteobacteria bacterium]|nr:hypothetical protein [Pseudomonadota bacterium]
MDITGLGSLFDFGSKVLERIFPDPKDRLEAQTKLEQMRQTGELAQLAAGTDLAKGQLEINKIEASNANLFVSGARPFIMWVCGIAFAYTLILQPFMIFACAVYGKVIPPLPNIDTNLLGWALGGILGLGTMRTTEKIKGVANIR